MQKILRVMLCNIAILLAQGAPALAHEYFTVITVPEGDQPKWVREAWVGLKLPFEQRIPCPTGEPGHNGSTILGYVVREFVAINILEQQSPKAAAWWREHGFGTDENRGFCFSPEVPERPL